MRVIYGAASVAALSALTAGLVHPKPPVSGTTEVAFDTAPVAAAGQGAPQSIEVRHIINYVYLQPGQVAPPGAKVITPDAPAPRIVITTVPGPVTTQPSTTTATATQPKNRVRTHQSGTP
jgi:hypothetical protein